jgi:hypothetical protein
MEIEGKRPSFKSRVTEKLRKFFGRNKKPEVNYLTKLAEEEARNLSLRTASTLETSPAPIGLFEKTKGVLAERLRKAKADNNGHLSSVDEVWISNKFYCEKLNYEIRREGLFFGKAKIFDKTADKYVAYDDGKTSIFKSFYFDKTENKMKIFLEQRLKETLEKKDKLTEPKKDDIWWTDSRNQKAFTTALIGTAVALAGITIHEAQKASEIPNISRSGQISGESIIVEKPVDLYRDVPENEWFQPDENNPLLIKYEDDKSNPISVSTNGKKTNISVSGNGTVVFHVMNPADRENKVKKITIKGLSSEKAWIYKPITPEEDSRQRGTNGISSPKKIANGVLSVEIPSSEDQDLVTKIEVRVIKRAAYSNPLPLIIN